MSTAIEGLPLTLGPWHVVVSRGSGAVLLELRDGRPRITEVEAATGSLGSDSEVASGTPEVDGWYASYPEGVFSVFRDAADQHWVGWRDRFEPVPHVEAVGWHNGVLGRRLEIAFAGETPELSVRYQTWRALIRDPLYVLDDDWGLVADLPSVFDSWFDDGLRERFDEAYEHYYGRDPR